MSFIFHEFRNIWKFCCFSFLSSLNCFSFQWKIRIQYPFLWYTLQTNLFSFNQFTKFIYFMRRKTFKVPIFSFHSIKCPLIFVYFVSSILKWLLIASICAISFSSGIHRLLFNVIVCFYVFYFLNINTYIYT